MILILYRLIILSALPVIKYFWSSLTLILVIF